MFAEKNNLIIIIIIISNLLDLIKRIVSSTILSCCANETLLKGTLVLIAVVYSVFLDLKGNLDYLFI